MFRQSIVVVMLLSASVLVQFSHAEDTELSSWFPFFIKSMADVHGCVRGHGIKSTLLNVIKISDYLDYGCYCGVGSKGANPTPMDGIDQCCKVHDACFGHLVNEGDGDVVSTTAETPCEQGVAQCDIDFAKCLAKYPHPEKKIHCGCLSNDGETVVAEKVELVGSTIVYRPSLSIWTRLFKEALPEATDDEVEAMDSDACYTCTNPSVPPLHGFEPTGCSFKGECFKPGTRISDGDSPDLVCDPVGLRWVEPGRPTTTPPPSQKSGGRDMTFPIAMFACLCLVVGLIGFLLIAYRRRKSLKTPAEGTGPYLNAQPSSTAQLLRVIDSKEQLTV